MAKAECTLSQTYQPKERTGMTFGRHDAPSDATVKESVHSMQEGFVETSHK